jgi:DNA repair protein RadC
MTFETTVRRSAPSLRVTNPSDLTPVLSRYSRRKQEHFLVITLDGAQHVISVHIASIGLLNRTLVHPRETFRRAILDNSGSVILAHNHPSGDLTPSREDREATERMVKAGRILGIEVLDHLIITRSGLYSLKEHGEMQ